MFFRLSGWKRLACNGGSTSYVAFASTRPPYENISAPSVILAVVRMGLNIIFNVWQMLISANQHYNVYSKTLFQNKLLRLSNCKCKHYCKIKLLILFKSRISNLDSKVTNKSSKSKIHLRMQDNKLKFKTVVQY